MKNILFKREMTKGKAKELYDWAVQNQKDLGCMAEPIRINFKTDHLVQDTDDCMISVFYDEESGLAIMRRDWTDCGAVKFNILVNYDEIKQKAPNSARHMEENGKKLFNYYNADIATKYRLKNSGIPFYNYD